MIEKGLNRKNKIKSSKKEVKFMGLERTEKYRYQWGALDIISAILVLVGVYISQQYESGLGWVIVVLGIIKQFSGK